MWQPNNKLITCYGDTFILAVLCNIRQTDIMAMTMACASVSQEQALRYSGMSYEAIVHISLHWFIVTDYRRCYEDEIITLVIK